MLRLPAHYNLILLVAFFLCSCAAREEYQPRSIDEQAARATYDDRTPDDDGLAELVRASAYDGPWPPAQWRVETLTLLGLYFNPEIDVARAQALAARAALTMAAQRAPVSVELVAEHHSREVDGDGPWSLGVAVGLPVVTRARREARLEKATLLLDVAELEIAVSAWQIRAAVRDALIDMAAAKRDVILLEQRVAEHQALAELLQRRVDAGMLSSRELGRERVALSTAQAELALAGARRADALAELAAALALPLDTVRSLRITDHGMDDAINIPSAASARELALRNRVDVHRRLLEYGVADAELKLAVAAQYPEITLSPGFLWDQGDNVWSLVSGFVVPRAMRAAVHEAEARRELAAHRFSALQIKAIGDVEQAREHAIVTQQRVTAANAILDQARLQLERSQRYFESGSGDRVQLVAARLSMLHAQQHVAATRVSRIRSLARLEDACQAPLIAGYHVLPEQNRDEARM